MAESTGVMVASAQVYLPTKKKAKLFYTCMVQYSNGICMLLLYQKAGR